MPETTKEIISNQEHSLAKERSLFDESKSKITSASIEIKVDKFFLTHPVISTFFTAMMLASMWVAVWLAVLFFLTYASKTSVTPNVLVAGLLLSTIAEGVIRVAENSPRIHRYSSGSLKRDVRSFSASAALAYLLGGILLVMLLPISDWNHREFYLAATSDGNMQSMLLQWYDAFSNSKYLALGLIWCWLLRVLIYKKAHHTYEWNETKEFIEQLSDEERNAKR